MRRSRIEWVAFCAAIAFIAIPLYVVGCKDEAGKEHRESQADRDGHEGHDHDDHSDHEDEYDHDTGASQGHEEHGNEHSEDVIRLTQEQLKDAGVAIEPLTHGMIARYLTLPGEIGFNTDNVVHVTPRVSGIVAEVHSYIGDQVKQGQLLAVIDSPELGQAKIEYLTRLQSLSQAQADLERQRTISKNTEALLVLLKTPPDLVTLQEKSAGLRIGEHKGRLISAYAKLQSARANYKREQSLRDQGLSTQSDLLMAEEAFNSTQAEYLAAFEDIDFRFRADLTQAERAFRVAESGVSNADRRLHLFGFTQKEVNAIASEPDVAIARYELHSPLGGRIINKHISVGEKIEGDEPAYIVADLDTVWLNINVYAEYLSDIREDQPVLVGTGDRKTSGRTSYVSSSLSKSTRTVVARVVLQNEDRRWRPGEFVTVDVETGRREVDRAVPIEALQRYEGNQVVFVQAGDAIVPHPVRLGYRNDKLAELIAGPPPGTPIVVKNSFLMKAELGKSAAGHEH